MCACSHETEIISSLFLDKHLQRELDKIIEEIQGNINYDAAPLWNLEKSLLPINKYDKLKNLMIPLQCARDEIDIYNINYKSDYVILYCGKYLEEVLRYFLSIMRPVMKLKYKIASFNSLIKSLDQYCSLPSNLAEGARSINILMSKCISDGNFKATPKDSIITYVCSLLIGTSLLNSIDLHIKESEKKCLDTLYKLDS